MQNHPPAARSALKLVSRVPASANASGYLPGLAGNAHEIQRRLPVPATFPVRTPMLPTTGRAGERDLDSVLPGPRPVLVTNTPALARLSPEAALAHDARGALTSLHLLAGLFAEPGILAPKHAGLAADLETVTRSLGAMVEQLTQLAGRGTVASEARVTVPMHSASAGEALESCTGLLRTVAGPRITLHVSAASALPPLALADEALLRVLMNLVRNAAEAMGTGVVRITARWALSRTIPAVLIHVSDNGPGIPAPLLARIFEPGVSTRTLEAPGRMPANRGLGLTIVRELLQAAGGEVQVASTRRRGTTFELRIPAREARGVPPPALP